MKTMSIEEVKTSFFCGKAIGEMEKDELYEVIAYFQNDAETRVAQAKQEGEMFLEIEKTKRTSFPFLNFIESITKTGEYAPKKR